ncbi:MAG: hypothetical protein QNK35_06910 [Bacteroides sp.]|nr:hypothetical protein [Bacteroides sp.]
MKQLRIILSIIFAAFLLITSCVQDNFDLDLLSDEMELEPVLNLPLTYGYFDMDDLAEVIDSEDYSLEDEDGERYYLVYPDTIYWLDETLDFSTDLNQDVVTYMEMNLKSVNELAIKMVMQVFFEDENHVVLDSLFDNLGVYLGPAEIGSDGKLIKATENENGSTFDEDKLGILDEIVFMRVRAAMHASKGDSLFVKIYASYALNYEMALEVHTKINTGDLNVTE